MKTSLGKTDFIYIDFCTKNRYNICIRGRDPRLKIFVGDLFPLYLIKTLVRAFPLSKNNLNENAQVRIEIRELFACLGAILFEGQFGDLGCLNSILFEWHPNLLINTIL